MVERRIRLRGSLMALVLATAAWAGIPGESGRPLSRSFGPKEYGADAQNWALVQDSRGLLYAANNFGVLEFDGARWRLIHTRDGTPVRSLAKDAAGRVFVGARNEFGYLATDALGRTQYVPLEDRLPAGEREFGNVWTISATSQGVFFLTESWLFRWDGERMQRWKAPTAFFMSYDVRDKLLVLDKGRGLLEPSGDTLRPVPGGRQFAGRKPRIMVPWEFEGRPALLWASRADGLVVFEGRTFHPLRTGVDSYLKANILYSGIRRADGTLALTTIQGGVVLLEVSSNRARILDTREGLQNQSAYCVMEDAQGNLWVGGSKGIEALSWPGVSRFGEPDGLSGVVMDLRRHGGSLYATTNQGVFRLLPATGASGRPAFRAVTGIKGQCWDLTPLGSSLLVANYDGVYEVQGGRARRAVGSAGHTLSLGTIPGDPDRLIVGTVSGLRLLQRSRSDAPWRDLGPFGGIQEEVRSLTPDGPACVWVGCDAPLAARITFLAEGPPRVERFGPNQGLPEAPWYFTARIGGQPVVYCPSGCFRFDPATTRFQRDPRLEPLGLGIDLPLFRMVEAPDGRLWVGCRNQGTWQRAAARDSAGVYRWCTPPLEATDSPVYALHPERDGTLWLGGVDGVFRCEPAPRALPAPPVLIRSVLQAGGKPIPVGEKNPIPRIPFAGNTLRFEYTLPPTGPDASPTFQILLEGHDAGWSAWSAETYRDYTNLKSGPYRFRVRARGREGEVPSEASVAFRVLRPWYRSIWAYTLYLAAITGTLTLAHRMRVRLLKRRNEELEARVAEATGALARQASELEWMNRELRELDAQKNQFLGIVSHDLKAPLNGIIMAAETLRTAEDSRIIQATAQAIESEGLAMGALVERFLNLAALESGRIQAHPVPLEAQPLLQEALARHRQAAVAKGLPLSLESVPEGLRVKADPLLLGEVLDNLLSNSIKFSRTGEPVRVRAFRSGEQVRIVVEDHGPGLQAADYQRLFTRFARLSARPTRGEKSLGLGLSIARQLMETMGGRIGAEPEHHPGAAFWVELPAVD